MFFPGHTGYASSRVGFAARPQTTKVVPARPAASLPLWPAATDFWVDMMKLVQFHLHRVVGEPSALFSHVFCPHTKFAVVPLLEV